ncbi:UPAR/Ly6 domain-containing protein bero isoform X2 [Drosophila bipectinata]|uniref:UPAR/Ly6 domain-containing protein bero isoform X2 n=1 Tax=Drosophila bipectinata TaxID=42026 RepID=UPI001C8A7C7D|nr:uncharacterized protein LOC108119960 isoform X2 [Drosophila bipectinata]
METMALRAFLHLFLVVTLASAARAITCYECDSVNNPGCGENFAGDDIATSDCEAVADMRAPGMESSCLTKYYGGMPGEMLFMRRSCYFDESSPVEVNCDETPDPVVPYLNFLGCKVCNTDLCNAAGKGATLSIVAMIFVFGMLFSNYNY